MLELLSIASNTLFLKNTYALQHDILKVYVENYSNEPEADQIMTFDTLNLHLKL